MGDPKRIVADALVEHGGAVFEPAGGPTIVDFVVRGHEGQYVEVLARWPEAGTPRLFRMKRFRPRPHLFIVGVTWKEDEFWVLPSGVFERFAAGAPAGEQWDLDLDMNDGEPMDERLAVYRNRWKLITEFSKFRSTLSDPTALQVRLALG